MDWGKYMEENPQAEYPDLNVVRFVRRHFSGGKPGCALDIGCGAGANSKFLLNEGFRVWALDKHCRLMAENPNVYFVRADICSYELPPEHFEFVLDFNTLCHVEEPPWSKIYDSLSPGGRLLTVSPAEDTWRGTLEGKGFVRVGLRAVRDSLGMFSDVKIYRGEYPDFRGHQITSWVAEATK